MYHSWNSVPPPYSFSETPILLAAMRSTSWAVTLGRPWAIFCRGVRAVSSAWGASAAFPAACLPAVRPDPASATAGVALGMSAPAAMRVQRRVRGRFAPLRARAVR